MKDTIFGALLALLMVVTIGGVGYLTGHTPVSTNTAETFFHYLDKNGKCSAYPSKDGDAALCKTEAGLVALCTAPAGAAPDCKVILDTRPRPPQTAPAPSPAPTPAPTPPKAGAGSGSHAGAK